MTVAMPALVILIVTIVIVGSEPADDQWLANLALHGSTRAG